MHILSIRNTQTGEQVAVVVTGDTIVYRFVNGYTVRVSAPRITIAMVLAYANDAQVLCDNVGGGQCCG